MASPPTLPVTLTGPAASALFGLRAGFVNDQNFDSSPPPAPSVSDGLGADEDQTYDDSRICANWKNGDPHSGVFHHTVSLGTSSGAGDVVPRDTLGRNHFREFAA